MLDFWGVTKNYRQDLPPGEPQTPTKSLGLCRVNYKRAGMFSGLQEELTAAGSQVRSKAGGCSHCPQKSSCTTFRRFFAPPGAGWMLLQIRWVVIWLSWSKCGSVHKINCIRAAFKSPWQPWVYRQDDFIDKFIYTHTYIYISKMCTALVETMRNEGVSVPRNFQTEFGIPGHGAHPL